MKKNVLIFILLIFMSHVFVYADGAPDFDTVYKLIASELASVEKKLPNKAESIAMGIDKSP